MTGSLQLDPGLLLLMLLLVMMMACWETPGMVGASESDRSGLYIPHL